MTAAVETRDLRYRYPDGTEALRGITLRIEPGERVGLIGPNGAGKSTLLQHLNGVLPERPAPEAVLVHGLPVEGDRLLEVRRAVGMVFQDPDDQLFRPTVYEDVAFGPEQLGLDVPAAVAAALDRVGLAGFDGRAPHRLSRGEKRRACIAGVLACGPSVLVLDEPTGDLDPRGRRELRELLRGLEATLIVATHDLELVVDLCPRAILLDRGAIIADGPVTELLDDEPLMLAHGLERPHVLRHRHPH